MQLIFDAHLDLAMNAIEWNRDLTQSVEELRRREAGMQDKRDRERGTVSFPEMRKAGIGVCVATQLARLEHNAYSPIFGWRSPAQAWAMTQAQLAWYRAMEEAGEMVPITTATELGLQVERWLTADSAHTDRLPIGYILSLEGADSLVSLHYLERAHANGLRAIGPAHYGPGVYAFGTDSSGGLNSQGRELIKEMERLGLILDVTHLCDECFWDVMDLFGGRMWASHQNCRALVPHMRQFSDEQFHALIERDAVIGCALDAWMLIPGWVRGQTTPESTGLKLDHFINHIDHICQIAGNARHVGIGSDLDGCFGTEQTPQDLQTITDLTKVSALLTSRGFTSGDVAAISSGNFLRFLGSALPAS